MIFFLIVLTVNLLVNLFIFFHTRSVFPRGNTAWWITAILFWLVAFSYAIGRITERSGPDWLAEPFIRIGSYWLGAMTYLFLIFLLVDIVRGFHFIVGLGGPFRFKWNSETGKWAILVVYAVTAVILVAGYWSARVPIIERQVINLRKPVGNAIRKIVLVSDIHLGTLISNGRLETLVNKVNGEQPDLILLAGDVFDEDLGPVIANNMGDLLKNLRAKHGVYAILGNHEFYGNAADATKYLLDHNINVLSDTSVVLPGNITLIGRMDITGEHREGRKRKSLDELLSVADQTYPIIMMDHQPFKLAEVAKAGVDLQVSGHTHHGQLWPFNYITSSLFEISRGYGQIGDSHFFVSSGYGTWGPPIRTSTRSEIVVLELSGSEATSDLP